MVCAQANYWRDDTWDALYVAFQPILRSCQTTAAALRPHCLVTVVFFCRLEVKNNVLLRKKLTDYIRGMSFQFSFSTKATWLYTVFWQWGCLVWLAPGHDTSSWESFCSQEVILRGRPVYILVAAEGTSNFLFWAANRDLWRPRPWWSEIFIIWARSSDQSADVDKDKRSRCASHLTKWNIILTAFTICK